MPDAKSPAESVKALLGEPNPMGDYFYPDGSSIRRAGKFYVASWADGTAMMGPSEQTGIDVVWRFESPEEALVCLRDNDEGPFAKAVVSQVAYADLVAENERLRADLKAAAQLAKQVAESNTMLRKILCYVPGRIAIKAKEDAGFATHIKSQWEDVKADEAWVEFVLTKPKRSE